MELVRDVVKASAYTYSTPDGKRLLVACEGVVNTSGWSNISLGSWYYISEPDDKIQDIDFMGMPPSGMVAQVTLPVTASLDIPAPSWLEGVRVHASSGDYTIEEISHDVLFQPRKEIRIASGHVIIREKIASYEDSWQPIGVCGPFSVRMKKLLHELTLIVEGPDESKIRACIGDAMGVGLIAGLLSAFITGGAALASATTAFITHLKGCLGSEFHVRLNDSSRWEEWCT